MLQELRVENLLLIERAELRPCAGLNVITGETGAGKTILAHALDLLLGGRPRGHIVRPGAREAYVEGVFDASEDLLGSLGERLDGDGGEVMLARRVGADGRTRAYVNGRSATVGELQRAGSGLLAFYGQHEHRKLMLSAAQMEILDGLCGAAQAQRLAACSQALAERNELRGRLAHLRELAAAREREADLLAYEIREIEAIAPREDELEHLLGLRERLRRLDALRAAASAAAEALAGENQGPRAGAELIAEAAARLDALAGVDAALDQLAERVRALLIEARDTSSELRDYCERAGAEDPGGPSSLEAVEERLQAIERLTRKHGGSVAAVLQHAARAREREEELDGAEQAIARAEEQLAAAEKRLSDGALALRRARRRSAERLAGSVRDQLAALGMAHASFEVQLGERDPGSSGADTVEFVIAPNPGVPAGPVREIASGGELSRVMLAIMSVASGRSSGRTLVFDEVDAGIGGHTARAVGARLRELAARGQVLCITHLPQIASLGERHFSIVKDTRTEPTRTAVLELDEPQVVSELVRMLGADSEDATARRHASELRRAA